MKEICYSVIFLLVGSSTIGLSMEVDTKAQSAIQLSPMANQKSTKLATLLDKSHKNQPLNLQSQTSDSNYHKDSDRSLQGFDKNVYPATGDSFEINNSPYASVTLVPYIEADNAPQGITVKPGFVIVQGSGKRGKRGPPKGMGALKGLPMGKFAPKGFASMGAGKFFKKKVVRALSKATSPDFSQLATNKDFEKESQPEHNNKNFLNLSRI